MTEELDIRKKSEEVLNQYDELKRMESADEEYIKQIVKKKEDDDANRNNFLKYNAEMTGLSLEFRNIYGVEPMGVYKENWYSIRRMDQYGNLVSNSNGNPLYDSYKDGKELVDAAEMKGDSLFFVDSNKESDTSSFHIPYNPPYYKSWTGDMVYFGLSRRFFKTEKTMYNLIKNLSTPGGSEPSFTQYSGSHYFDSNNPAWFYSDPKGNILCDAYEIVPKEDTELKPPDGSLENSTYEYTVKSPKITRGSIMYTASGITSNTLEVGDVLAFKLSHDPNRIGYAFVALKESGKVLLDILRYTGRLVSRPRDRVRWRWWFKRQEYVDPNSFSISFSTIIKKDEALVKDLLSDYEKYYIEEPYGYIKQIENPTNSTKNSIASYNTMRTAFNNYRINNNLTILLNKMKQRIESIYGTEASPIIPPQRAIDINEEMKTSDTFEKVYEIILPRIDKRTGTLRELLKYENASKEAKKMMKLKERAISINMGTICAYRLINDGNESNVISISLERDTEEAFMTHIKWLSEVYLVCDDERIDPILVNIEEMNKSTDTIFKPAEDETLDSRMTYPFKRDVLVKSGVMRLKLSKNVPTSFKVSNNSRIVRLL